MSVKSLIDFDFGGFRGLNVGAPSGDNDAVRLLDLKNAIEGLKQKDPVVCRTTGNVNLAAPGATLDGVTLVAGNRELGSFLATNQTNPSENGIYIWNGASVPATRALDASTAAELNGALVPVKSGTSASTLWRQTAVISTLGVDPVAWAAFGTAAAAATETTAGILEVATQAEVDAGASDSTAVTPLKLANAASRELKLSQNIGDGAATLYTVTHNFNTRDICVNVYRNSAPYDNVLVDIERDTLNSIQVRFGVAPSSNAFRVVVTG